jgi:predicted metal-binding membrane protein
MRNIFELTKREQRAVIVIVVVLVAAALALHYLETRSAPGPETSTSSLSPTMTPQDAQMLQNEQAMQEQR